MVKSASGHLGSSWGKVGYGQEAGLGLAEEAGTRQRREGRSQAQRPGIPALGKGTRGGWAPGSLPF